MRRARVLHAITMLELGGAQRNTLDTCAMLDRGRFEVGLACADRGELLAEARALADVRRYELRHLRREVRPWLDFEAFRELRAAIREFAPDLVHTHSSKAGVLGRAAARAERVPVIVHSIHGWGFGSHQSAAVHATFLAAERVAARWTSHFVAVSRANLEQGVELGLFGREQASVIRSGIDLEAFRCASGGEQVRSELGIPAGVPLVVQVSCLKPQKAPERFVALAAALAPRFPDAHFVLVGDGELRSKLEVARAAAGLEGRLHLPGWRRDVPAVLDAATVVTLTSRFEGLPRVVVEALAARRVVVAMAVDGVREVLRDGINGYAVAPGDEAVLAERVAELLTDPSLRARLSAPADEGLEAWDRTLMVRQQEELYARLLAAAGRGGRS
ncbi:MAG: glycosyltransferase family 4 protein [Thermoanaerobaculaceae bacterium]|nr:glycosyltransferase family 4 protein [Thermoanaerobaculaceae bacterium]MDI9620548.1 glycosyltransferase family 4 protein [Acidobacteriota bacterium]NLH11931.1 glycosyltransferase family 4 protein [Holophagae bacterium]HPW55213.1 glycosyltransferase family 4 protein [Thermoanaerobaculaceae bacterium]